MVPRKDGSIMSWGIARFGYSQARPTPTRDDSPRLPRRHPVPRWAFAGFMGGHDGGRIAFAPYCPIIAAKLGASM